MRVWPLSMQCWLRRGDLNLPVLTNSLWRICLRSPRGSDSPPDCHSLPLGRSLSLTTSGYSPFGLITRNVHVQFIHQTKKNQPLKRVIGFLSNYFTYDTNYPKVANSRGRLQMNKSGCKVVIQTSTTLIVCRLIVF